MFCIQHSPFSMNDKTVKWVELHFNDAILNQNLVGTWRVILSYCNIYSLKASYFSCWKGLYFPIVALLPCNCISFCNNKKNNLLNQFKVVYKCFITWQRWQDIKMEHYKYGRVREQTWKRRLVYIDLSSVHGLKKKA